MFGLFKPRKSDGTDELLGSVEEFAQTLAEGLPKDQPLSPENLVELERIVCELALTKPQQAWAAQGSLMRDTIGPAIERRLKAEVHRQFLRHLPTNILPEGTA